MNYFEYNIDKIQDPPEITDLYKARTYVAECSHLVQTSESKATVMVLGYNRLDKTKRCVESVLKYTDDVDYNLILIDNGSTDGTLEYFKSVKHDKLTVVHITKNMGGIMVYSLIDPRWISKYLVGLPNDVIVTKNWLSNLITVAESDPTIGMVNPMTSNVSNWQMYDMQFTDYDDMQEKAAIFNMSDSTKWQERMRLVTLGTLLTKECMYAIGWPNADVGFFHNFGDDDITFRVRHAGYKAILAGDTWIHHDHDVFNMEDKDPVKFKQNIDTGRENFKQKHFGIDAWDDVNNYIFPFMKNDFIMPVKPNNINILGIDTKCGTPILDVKNMLREYGIFNTNTYSFFQEGKYYIDSKTACNKDVVCDRIENVYNSFKSNFFDYIVLGKNINEYFEPEKIIRDVHALLNENGQFFFTMNNTYNIYTFMKTLGFNINDYNSAYNYHVDDFCDYIRKMGINVEIINSELMNVNEHLLNFARQFVPILKPDHADEKAVINRLFVSKYWLKITK